MPPLHAPSCHPASLRHLCFCTCQCLPTAHRPRPTPVLQQREFDAVHRVRQVEKSLLRFMLKPQLLTPIGAYYENPVSDWLGGCVGGRLAD